MRVNKFTSGKILEQGINSVFWLDGLIEDIKTLDNITSSGEYKKSPEGILNYYKTHKILFQKVLNLFYKTITKDVRDFSFKNENKVDTDLKLFNMSVFKSFSTYCSVIDKMFIKKCIESIVNGKIDLSLLNLCEDQDLKYYSYSKNYIIFPESNLFNNIGLDTYIVLMSNNDHRLILSLLKAMLCIIINIQIGTDPNKQILNNISEFQGVANNIRSL